MDNLKAEQIGSAKWRVLAIPFGGPKGGKDTDREFFDHETDVKPHWFRERPVIFHHGQDAELKDDDLGVEDDLEEKKDGHWATMWLDRSHRYWAQMDQWLREGKMFGSSGSIAHLVRKSRNGHIDVWPHAEQTLTLTPANFYSRVEAAKLATHFNSAGIELSDTLKSVLDELDARSDDLTPDLSNGGESDLSLGGDEAAMKRLVALTNAQLARLRAL